MTIEPYRYYSGFDLVRVFAIVLVTAQHALTLLGHEELTLIRGISVGQVGVALFMAMSGFLAAQSQRLPVSWLFQRLRRIYPAFWIVTLLSFLLTWLSGHKQFNLLQVISQMLGIGLFTHPDNLVNVPTWFVSLLLVCYVGTCVARFAKVAFLASVGVSLYLALYVGFESAPWLSTHILIYSLASTIALVRSDIRQRTVCVLCLSLFLLGILVRIEFLNAAIALTIILLAETIRSTPRFIRWIAELSYEYYLIHGVVLFGAIKLLPTYPIASVFLAVSLAMVAAVGLHWFVESVVWGSSDTTSRLR